MGNKHSRIEIVIAAKDLNLTSVFAKVQAAHKAFVNQMGSGNATIAGMRSQVLQLVGAMAGLQAIGDVGTLLQQADRNAYGLATSIQAANREFKVGSAGEWEQTITELSAKLRVYSQSDIRGAAASTIDMTKRLGLNAEQMKKVIALSGDLAVGRTDLAGAVERVTSALRGEAEASEFLGLTLNETYVKSWYEAKGAMHGAWKDLNDLQKAQVRYNVFLEQAAPLQGKAAGSINTYDGALKLIKATVSDSISTNEDLVASLANIATVLRDNSAVLGSFFAAMASGAAKVIAFVAANQEAIITAGQYGLAFGAAIVVIGRLIATVQGLNAAFTVLTGAGVVTWLRAVESGSIAATVGVTGLRIGFVGLLGATAAFLAAYKAGEWLTMGKEMRAVAEAQGELERATKKVNSEFKKISAATGETIASMEDLDKAVADGRIHYDELTGTWVKGAKQQQQASQQTAAAMKQATGEALEAMKKKYQDYAQEIRRIQADIYGREKSLAAELREMSRSGMSDTSAWEDRKREAEEYATAAKSAAQQAQAAMKAGDTITAGEKWKEAVQYADDAKTAYKSLNTEVKNGEQVVVSQQQALQTSMAGVKQAGELAIEILKQQQAASNEAMNALTKDSGFVDLAKGMDEAEQKWLENWKNMQQFAAEQVEYVKRRIDGMVEDRHVTIWVTEKVKKAEGGMVHLAGGGMVPGYSPHQKADNIQAMLTAREFVEPVSAVNHYQPWVFEALRRKLVDRDSLHAFLRNGLSRLPNFADGGPVHFAVGGMVPAAQPQAAQNFGTLNISLGGGKAIPVTTTRESARLLKREFERQAWRANK